MHVPEEFNETQAKEEETLTVTRTPSPSPLQLSPQFLSLDSEEKKKKKNSLLRPLETPSTESDSKQQKLEFALLVKEIRDAADKIKRLLGSGTLAKCPSGHALADCSGKDFWLSASEWVNDAQFIVNAYAVGSCDWCTFKPEKG